MKWKNGVSVVLNHHDGYERDNDHLGSNLTAASAASISCVQKTKKFHFISSAPLIIKQSRNNDARTANQRFINLLGQRLEYAARKVIQQYAKPINDFVCELFSIAVVMLSGSLSNQGS